MASPSGPYDNAGSDQEPTYRDLRDAGSVRRSVRMRPVNLLLLIPLIGTLVPSFYNKDAPRLGGMPFFYWYQLIWIPISVALTCIVYRATKGARG